MTVATAPQLQTPARLTVGVIVSNDILRGGLEVALRGLDLVGDVYHRSPDDPTPASGDADVIILGVPLDEVVAYAARLRTREVKLLVLVNDPRAAEAALAMGLVSDGFLLQQELSSTTLETALRSMVRGDIAVPGRLGHQLLASAGQRRSHHLISLANLTPRENETLALLTEGLSNKQIARRLKISEHGAKRLVAGVLLKLGSSNRTTAVVTAIRAGLIQPT